MTACSIHIKNAHLAYKQQVLFSDLTFEIAGGQWTAVLGPSGVGKSTLIKMITGHVQHYKDCQVEANITTSDGQPLEGRIAYMGQSDLLMPWLSVLDNVLLGERLRANGRQAKTKAKALLEEVGLGKHVHERPHALSGGMRQRVALARTLMEARPIVLMDEPFSALDAITRLRLQDLFMQTLKGKTVLLITHDPLEALRMCHQVFVMSGKPAKINEGIKPPGEPLRALDDDAILHLQGALLSHLTQGEET